MLVAPQDIEHNTKQEQEPAYTNVFKNNTLEDIAKMSKEEWREKLRLQKLYINAIRHEPIQQSLIDKFFSEIDGADTDKYTTIFKGISIEEDILNGKLSRYYVIQSEKPLSKEQLTKRENKELAKTICKIAIISFAAFIMGLTRVIKPSTALMVFVSSPLIVCATMLIDIKVKSDATKYGYEPVKKLYARHYHNDIFIKNVDLQTQCGEYHHMI